MDPDPGDQKTYGNIEKIRSFTEPLTEMRKPNFSYTVEEEGGMMAKACLRGLEEVEDRLKGSLEEDRLKNGGLEDSCGEADQDCMPFANERAGTIKYKTNPQVHSYIQTFFQVS
jgi:hypothetical protein